MTNTVDNATNQAKQAAKQATNEVKPWVITLARLGYVVKGIVYITLGLLAFQAALGLRSANIDQKGALLEIFSQPYGKFLLIVMVVGLFGYALWRFIEAIFDPEHKGTDAKGLLTRASYLFSGAGYGFLGIVALQILNGTNRSGSSNTTQDWTARLMRNPAGVWLVGLAGLAVIGAGLYQLYLAFTEDFKKHFKTGEMSKTEITWAKRLGAFGSAARSIVYMMVGVFLVQSAVSHNPSKAGGIGQAFQALVRQPFGPWLLGALALGLIAYGLYAILTARYRQISIL